MTDNKYDPRNMYDVYSVAIRIRDRLYGGTPKNSEVIAAWVKARTGYDDEQTKVQTAEALKVATDDVAEKMWTGFPADDGGLFVWARQVKAMLRESATMLGITRKKRGSKQVIQHGFEVKGPLHEQRIHIGQDEPCGTYEGPIHVITAQGPRTALKRQDFVEGVTLEFEIWILATMPGESRRLGLKEIEAMLVFAQENGLGASRSQGHGKFDIQRLEHVGKGTPPIASAKK